MSFMQNVVGQMIGNMSPEERSQAVAEVTSQGLGQMEPSERAALAQHLLTMLVDSVDADARRELVRSLGQQLGTTAGQ